MPQFSYKARKRSGELVEGVLEVADRSAALVQIQRSGLFPIAVADDRELAAVVLADERGDLGGADLDGADEKGTGTHGVGKGVSCGAGR